MPETDFLCFCDEQCTFFVDCCDDYTTFCREAEMHLRPLNRVSFEKNLSISHDCQEYGDMTGDGLVNIEDVLMLIDTVINGKEDELSFCEHYVVDLDSSAMLDIVDVTLLIQQIIG